MIRHLARLLSGERAFKGLAIAIAVLLVTAIASAGQVRHAQRLAEGTLGAAESPLAGETTSEGQWAEPGTSPTEPTEAAAGTSATGSPTRKTTNGDPGQSTATASPKVPIPDFGLKTQGVTDKEVKVGVDYNVSGCGDAGVLEAMYGPAVSGDPKKAFDAFVRHVNDSGGIRGRTLKWVAADDGAGGCPEKTQGAAIKLVEEDKVFMVLPGLDQVAEYAISKKIPTLGGKDDPVSLARYGANGVWALKPIEPTLESWAAFGKHYLDTPKHVPCLIHPESGEAGDYNYFEKILVEKMKKHGMAFKDIIVYKGDVATAQQQSSTAVTRAKANGCDQVYFMAGNAIAAIFFTDAATHNLWYPTWTWTSYTVGIDWELAGRLMDQTQWANAIGLSPRVPAGEHPKEGNCKKIYEKYNPGDGQSESAAVTVACAYILTAAETMNRAIDRTGVLTANSWPMGVDTVKGDFYFDSHVPITWSIPGPKGPFKTQGMDHDTVAKWDVAQSKYVFPEYPKYWKVMGPNKGGWEDLRSQFKKEYKKP
ncbi:MAG: ABC transporter substrate-binding protein [Actinomycetota bacterium]